jgi:phage terminase large subunit
MIKTQAIYDALYRNKDKFIILITGGRGSGKSFNASTFIERMTFVLTPEQKIAHQILYTRYTMASAGISIIPEFLEKAELDGTERYFKTRKNDVTNKMTGSNVMFRGIKTSSGNQTAKLKSIKGLSCFVVDEAEEFVSERDYETILFSIRQKGIQNVVVIIMNPTDNNHWVYKRYIEKTHKIVYYDGVPVQISTHPNVLHIHTTYLDNINNLSPEFLKEINTMKSENPDKYAHIVIGKWSDVAAGAIFKTIYECDDIPEWCEKVAIGLDFGFTNDPTAAIQCGISGDDLYLDEKFYETGMLSGDIIREMKETDLDVIADSADPRLIEEIYHGGVNIYSVEKGDGSIIAGLDFMQGMRIHVTRRSFNLQKEFRNYTWDVDKEGNYINKPIDAYNHGIDAVRYYCLGKLLGKIRKRDNDDSKYF